MPVCKESCEIRISAEQSTNSFTFFLSVPQATGTIFALLKACSSFVQLLITKCIFSSSICFLSVGGFGFFIDTIKQTSLKDLYRAQTQEESIYCLRVIMSSGLLSLPWSVLPERILRAVCATDETHASLLASSLKYQQNSDEMTWLSYDISILIGGRVKV